MKEGEYERPIRGVVIFNDNKIKKVEKFMKIYGVEFSIYRIKDQSCNKALRSKDL